MSQPNNTPDPKKQDFKPLYNVCEFLNGLHLYVDEARKGIPRTVEANHYCAQITSPAKGENTTQHTVRQCLLYDSHDKNARLIGVEYMIPYETYQALPPDEQRLWHSHEFEVKSGLLAMPRPEGFEDEEAWESKELEAMKEVIGLYGKTWHFWQVDRGDDLPLGTPRLMGAMTHPSQAPLDTLAADRNRRYGIDHKEKAKRRRVIQSPEIHPNADSWFKNTLNRIGISERTAVVGACVVGIVGTVWYRSQSSSA